jgi:signal peptidase I
MFGKKKKRNKKRSFIYEFFDTIVGAFVIAMLIKAVLLEAVAIPSGSMENTLLINDKLFIDKLFFGVSIPFTKVKFHILEFRKPKQGDIVVFIPPKLTATDKKFFIKICVGIPGDKIQFKDRILYINGKPINEDYVKISNKYNYIDWPFRNMINYSIDEYEKMYSEEPEFPPNWPPQSGAPYTVPENYYFMCGDHRSNSSDSRIWGPVPYKYIIGIARFRWYPFNRIGLIK